MIHIHETNIHTNARHHGHRHRQTTNDLVNLFSLPKLADFIRK